MSVKIEKSWQKALAEEFEKDYFLELAEKVRAAYSTNAVFPPPKLVFNAFNLCPLEKTRVVIIGQDPYHGHGQAHGLSFSVPTGVRIPPSLRNIYQELEDDLGLERSQSGNLEHWATEGVLLLNSALTVEKNKAGSHRQYGWEKFTDAVIKTISDQKKNIVFILWGNFAKEKESLIDSSKHLILTAAHPSPFSAHSGFFGCKHFSQTNNYLKKHNQKPIKW